MDTDSTEKPQGTTSPVANFDVAHFLSISSFSFYEAVFLQPCKNYISKTSLEDVVLQKSQS